MSNQPTTALKLERLPWVVSFSAFNSVFCQLTVFGSAFLLLMSKLGFQKSQIGFLVSLMPFCGPLVFLVWPLAARAGYKRVFLSFWALRSVFVAFLLATPLVLEHFGGNGAFVYVVAVLGCFALSRAIGETGYYPWAQEFVPHAIRGKFSAINGAVAMLVSLAAVAAAGYWIGQNAEISRYLWVIAVGVAAGGVSVLCGLRIPGGRPLRQEDDESGRFAGAVAALRDRRFLRFLLGIGLVLLGSGPLASFGILYLQDHVGLTDGQIIFLQAAGMTAGLLTSFLWGWAADRYGSKPVTMLGLCFMVLVPIAYALLPRHSDWSLGASAALFFFGGAAGWAYSIGSTRALFVNVVPTDRRSGYMAVYYAWIGLLGGAGPLTAGWAIDACSRLDLHLGLLHVGPYTPMFAAVLALLLGGVAALSRVHLAGDIRTGRFAGMFLRGNLLAALGSMVRYSFAHDEPTRIALTERMGQAKSPFTTDELIDGLGDPSFNVRYEALVSIARGRSESKLLDAVRKVLTGPDADLATAAAWALGRLGDPAGVAPLREALDSPYPLLRARAARALAVLSDASSAEIIHQHYRRETDPALRQAYAASLGALAYAPAAAEIAEFLRASESPDARGELALALARIVDDERYFTSLWRKIQPHPETPLSQAMGDLRRRLKKLRQLVPAALARRAEALLSEGDIEGGGKVLVDLIEHLETPHAAPATAGLLRCCADCLRQYGAKRLEYFVLALHALRAALAGNYVRPRPEGPNRE